ncbi:glycosyl hydrolase family 39 [Marvinbryantia formatexigens DSM 14469]|uniref:Glycosyl hydrolase family 39 n=1 Tax=Marvinbryantia formatexigens DSM 14469 TaxID=478749 RepID=C6LCQ7_9FIRM|nr:glycoside hydrolase [Marvinbryantia formatexigens]EET61721.1 glycosyl hydrolase family 39 [Marvinbryantia formatexigens DSM 14469]UWO24466.1 hypothetical protein NQ534_18935 [Marvinbryantia formatexigens DSM 14469]SDF09160.1 Glycosyl hydrolases family 39 [Marvinbryantia formatexigens]
MKKKSFLKRITALATGFLVIGIAIPYFTETADVLVDFSEGKGEIRAVNGINNGPKSGYQGDGQWSLDATEIYRELEIPFVRTHDSEYPYGSDRFIDIHCIFPDFSKDPEDPDAYNFEGTDEYLVAIADAGAEVFLRLGESIAPIGDEIDEVWRERDKNQYIHPPEDYEKWAAVCEHIIRHYNEGWNDGFHMDITYWEIWNEPDTGRMWTGSPEEFYELYKVTARYLKERYPDIKIGGCGFSSVSEEAVEEFLLAITADGTETPLDFFSWHTYSDSPGSIAGKADLVRSTLDANGYEDTLSVISEWNYTAGWNEADYTETWEVIRSQKGASFIAASMITMQEHDVDMAMYYDGQFVSDQIAWCGLYLSEEELLPGYYAFANFRQLTEKSRQVTVTGSQTEKANLDGLYVCAAAGGTNGILLTNYNPDTEAALSFSLKFTGWKHRAVITRYSAGNPEGEGSTCFLWMNRLEIELEPYEIMYIELK